MTSIMLSYAARSFPCSSSFLIKSAVKIISAVKNAAITYVGSVRAFGTLPSIISLTIPPPTAVNTPSTHTPNISIFRFIPTIAPEAEKATVPISSAIKMIIS